ncbi:MAG TPA: class I SAM-dependent methyltransferase [Thermomicrobiaceae bacterium]|nr:class I SAM-dependent methyltransferase [Thermomicrobiaceae bacterium]
MSAIDRSNWTFEQLIEEADTVSVAGWDFSWLDGRASEGRPSWGYSRLIAERLHRSQAALDIQTGGGEVLAGAAPLPPLTVAVEGWPPNWRIAQQTLAPLGAHVVAAGDDGPVLPLRGETFDLVICRHPVRTWWTEIARVLKPGGTYLSQEIGPGQAKAVTEWFMGPQPASDTRTPERHRRLAEQAGLDVVDLRLESLPMAFNDIGAVVYFLRKVIWTVPDFSVERYRDRLLALHQWIQDNGAFRAQSVRFLIEARKPE